MSRLQRWCDWCVGIGTRLEEAMHGPPQEDIAQRLAFYSGCAVDNGSAEAHAAKRQKVTPAQPAAAGSSSAATAPSAPDKGGAGVGLQGSPAVAPRQHDTRSGLASQASFLGEESAPGARVFEGAELLHVLPLLSVDEQALVKSNDNFMLWDTALRVWAYGEFACRKARVAADGKAVFQFLFTPDASADDAGVELAYWYSKDDIDYLRDLDLRLALPAEDKAAGMFGAVAH